MSDELHKKVFSVPPPLTDEIDGEWGAKGEAEEKRTKTATEAADQAVTPAKDSGPPGANAQLKKELQGQAETAASPGTAPHASPSDEEDQEDEDDEYEDEDEDEEAHSVASADRRHAPLTRSSPPGVTDDWLPNWAPWGVLGVLIAFGIVGGLGGLGKARAESTTETGSAQVVAASKPTSVAASHFLVMYKGSMRAPESITRSKDEAKARALEGLAKLKNGEDFSKVVGEYSDEPGAAQRGGALGEFTADQMVKPFADAAFALQVGQVSGLVETPFGYHVIKRTK